MSFMSLFMDVFFFTADPSLTPETGLTTPMPPQHFPVRANASSGSFQPNLPAGQYTCRVQANSAQNLVDAFGRYPVSSNNVEVSIP